MTQNMKLAWFGVLMSLMGRGVWAVEPSAFTQTVQSETNGLTLTLQVDLTQLKYDPANGGALTLPGCQTIPVPGGWAVPTTEFPVILPPHVVVTALDVLPTTEAVSGVDLALQQRPRSPNDCPTPDLLPLARTIFPDTWAALGTASYHHGVHVQTIRVSPVRLDFLAGQVIGARQIVLHLTWQAKTTPDSFIKPQTTHPEAKRLRAALKASAVNGANLEALTDVQVMRALTVNRTAFPTYVPKSPTGTVDGVILCPEALVSAYQPLADDKTRAGHPWEIVTYEWINAQPPYQSGLFTDAPARIRAFLQEAYAQYNLQFVLFGGDGPPFLPSWVDRNWNNVLSPNRSFGYYTNLDGGDHTDLHTLVEDLVVTVRIGNPNGAANYIFRITETLVSSSEEVTPTPTRCGYIPFGIGSTRATMIELGSNVPVVSSTLSYNPMFDGFPPYIPGSSDGGGAVQTAGRAWVRAHPEYINYTLPYEEVVQRLPLSTCDLTPELLAGYLPPPPALEAVVGLGLYQTKLHRFQEPQNPAGIVAKNWSILGERCPVYGFLFTSFTDVVYQYGGVTPPNYEDPPHKLNPEGYGWVREMHGSGGCTNNGASEGWRSWKLSPLVDHPELGALTAVYEGMAYVGFHAGPGNRPSRMAYEFEAQYGWPFSRLGLYSGYEGWSTGHMSVFMGDPSLKPWAGTPERLVVTHPTSAMDAFDVTVKDSQNQPLPGAGVALSKRRPDGTYALYQRATTDANGVATFTMGDVTALGAGVLAVEIDAFPKIPFRDFYPYHGRVKLPTNTDPTLVVNTPIEIIQTTPQGSWVILDAGASFDPDGDPVELTWIWTDNRTGTPVVRTETGRYLRAFLPAGANAASVRASDGHAVVTQALTLIVKDVTPPSVFVSPVTLTHWHTWATVPVRVNNPAMGGLNFTASDALSGIGPWAVTAVTSNDPRSPAPVTFSLLPSNDLFVYAEDNPDGSARTYTVTVQVQDGAGNPATVAGRITVAPLRPPALIVSSIAVTLRADWVTVPIYSNDPHDGRVLNVSASDPRGLVGWRVTSVQANDPRQPAPVTFTLQDMSVQVLTEGNEDQTIRRYLVSVEAWNTLGLTATAIGEIGVVPAMMNPVKAFLFKGQVGQGAQQDPSGAFVSPPVILTAEPTTVVQFASPDGSLTVRAQVEADGRWSTWLPINKTWNVQATRGSRNLFVFDYYWPDPTTSLFQALTPPGVNQANVKYLDPYGNQFVSRDRPSGNQSPIARVVVPIGSCVSPVILDGRDSSDPDGDLLTYTWTWTQNRTAYRRSGPVVSAPLLLGSPTITLTVSDGTASTTKVFTVSVVKPSTLIQVAE